MLYYTIDPNPGKYCYNVWNKDWSGMYESLNKSEFETLARYCDIFNIPLVKLSESEYREKLARDIKGYARDYS